MQLRRLAALERKKIETEYKEVTATIKELTTLLKSPKLMRGVVADELLKVKAAYGDRRRTQIVNLKAGAKAGKTLTARGSPDRALGMVKNSLITELPGPSSQTFILVRVNEGDRLGWVGLTDGKKKDILLVTSNGMAIRFKEDDVRPMGLVAAGGNGIKLDASRKD